MVWTDVEPDDQSAVGSVAGEDWRVPSDRPGFEEAESWELPVDDVPGDGHPFQYPAGLP